MGRLAADEGNVDDGDNGALANIDTASADGDDPIALLTTAGTLMELTLSTGAGALHCCLSRPAAAARASMDTDKAVRDWPVIVAARARLLEMVSGTPRSAASPAVPNAVLLGGDIIIRIIADPPQSDTGRLACTAGQGEGQPARAAATPRVSDAVGGLRGMARDAGSPLSSPRGRAAVERGSVSAGHPVCTVFAGKLGTSAVLGDASDPHAGLSSALARCDMASRSGPFGWSLRALMAAASRATLDAALVGSLVNGGIGDIAGVRELLDVGLCGTVGSILVSSRVAVDGGCETSMRRRVDPWLWDRGRRPGASAPTETHEC